MAIKFPKVNEQIIRLRWRLKGEFARLIALYSGPPYKPNHRRITIDVTNYCNLNCFDCNRSCGYGQAMSIEHISLDQIRKFIQESLLQERKWQEILIEGGEPTLHPDLPGIVNLLLEYKKKYSPGTHIQVNSNGYDSNSDKVLAKLPSEMKIFNSQKQTPRQKHHFTFNVAPIDLATYKDDSYSNGCFLTTRYGIGLIRYGYYPHPICGNTDRVFGFDIGRKTLPSPGDSMKDQFQALCKYCGHYKECNPKRILNQKGNEEKGKMSPVWIKAYADYKEKKPVLSLY